MVVDLEIARRAVTSLFDNLGVIESLHALEIGHIHHTFIGTWKHGDVVTRYIHQRVNSHVFPDIRQVASNIERVTAHLRSVPSSRAAIRSEVMFVEPSVSGASVEQSEDGSWWRTFRFVENTVNYSECPSILIAEEGAFAFGEFVRRLSGMNPSSLYEPIPFFMHTPRRIGALRESVADDSHGRMKGVLEEIAFISEREGFVNTFFDRLVRGEFPIRVTHNDTKINNVLFDAGTNRAACIVDLDLCMAGTILFDTGELLRTAASTASEDEQDLSKVKIDSNRVTAIERGYRQGVGDLLREAERREFLFSGWLNALNLVVRFLTDYIAGDTYFRIHRPTHNLDRVRAQMMVVQSFEELDPSLKPKP